MAMILTNPLEQEFGELIARLPKRIQTRIKIVGDCWLWLGSRTANGYGRAWLNKRWGLSHREIYRFLIGEVPIGLELDHLCRERLCCNPNHLEPVTRLENVRRGRGHGSETHCPQGHPYSGENLIVTNRGDRLCRACQRISNIAAKHRQREKQCRHSY